VVFEESNTFVDAFRQQFLSQTEKYQHFMSFPYQVGIRNAPQRCIAKVENTVKELSIRYIVSYLSTNSVREIYFGLYLQCGEVNKSASRRPKPSAITNACPITATGPTYCGS
jgi:hypothetical protein